MWPANQRQRRDRLDAARLEALAALGVDWAQPS
ncbi:helicase [Streptomyces sp. NPDC090077]